MSKSILTAEIDMVSLTRQLIKAAKGYKEGQEQAVKRWGVQTCRELAVRTTPFGRTQARLKKAMYQDAFNVLYTIDEAAQPNGGLYEYVHNGKIRYIPSRLYLKSTSEINAWIERHRTASRKRTRKLYVRERGVCKTADLKKVIAQRFREKGGTAKDGWIDAGNSIGRGQKGKKPDRIGANFIKWARKPAKNGRSKEGSKNFNSFGELFNDVGYVSTEYMLSTANKKQAVTQGGLKTIKWYQRTMRAEAKKKRK